MKNIRISVTILLLLLPSILIPLYHSNAQPQAIQINFKLGGPRYHPIQVSSYNSTGIFYEIKSKIDKNNNNIEDSLEEKIKQLPPNQTVKVIIAFSSKPIPLGGNQSKLKTGIDTIIQTLKQWNISIIAGPWMHALVGFAVKLPVNLLLPLTNMIPKMDLDGDGKPDTFLVSEDKEYYALNHWSSRQMGIRPYVWNNLGVKGSEVTVVVIDTGIDGSNSAFPSGKIVYWKDYVGDPNGNKHDTPYDDNMHGTHVSGTIAGYYNSFDNQGRLVLNFGISDLDWSNAPTNEWLRFTSPYVSYYVDNTGVLEADFMWKGDTTSTRSTGAFDSIGIAFCGNITYYSCQINNIVAQTTTPNENTWYNITYSITSSAQFGFYTLVFKLSKGGGLAFLPILRVPVNPEVGNSIPYLSGMAPDAKLGGAKVLSYYGSGSTSTIASAIDDVMSNRTNYVPPLYVISMSLGGSYDSTIDIALNNAATSGILSVVAAGNDGAGTGDAATGSPASNPYSITVAAIDAFNNITDYSSDGGQSTSNSSVIKPDLSAPGGGYDLMIFSADTTWHDDLSNAVCWYIFCSEDIDWSDALNINTEGYDDSLGISGTSMATPHISGLAALVISALLNNDSLAWDWNSFSTAGLVKNIIMISTYETFPLMREPNNATYSPTLDKGGKDVHEGLGAVDAMAAVDLALSYGVGKAVLPGSVIAVEFRNGTAYKADFPIGKWSWPWGRSVWASRVYLPIISFDVYNGSSYDVVHVFKLVSASNDLSNNDLDLYLFDTQGNKYGEPIILAKSTEGMGVSTELIQYTPSSDSVVLAAKRAREDSSGGPAYILVGPNVTVQGLTDGGSSNQYAYTGYNVEIYGFSAYGAPNAIIEILDNTTGQILSTIPISTTSHSEGYSDFTMTWTVPGDPSLDGHKLLFIVTFKDNAGNTVEGPSLDSLTVNSNPPPVPEPWWIALAVIIVLVAFSWKVMKII
ncbi:MAG: S8 family serine peptidase [Desulfurococcales archaeon]|nr:S8 family serine peptidase [Desulfurococcales archaeon]